MSVDNRGKLSHYVEIFAVINKSQARSQTVVISYDQQHIRRVVGKELNCIKYRAADYGPPPDCVEGTVALVSDTLRAT